MRYKLFISDLAREQFRALPKDVRRNIGYRIDALLEDLLASAHRSTGYVPETIASCLA